MRPLYALFLGTTLSFANIYNTQGCYACHGSDAKGGNGFPALANSSKASIVRKLEGYKSGALKSDVMSPYAKKLSKAQIEEVANYLQNIENSKARVKAFFEAYDLSDSGN